MKNIIVSCCKKNYNKTQKNEKEIIFLFFAICKLHQIWKYVNYNNKWKSYYNDKLYEGKVCPNDKLCERKVCHYIIRYYIRMWWKIVMWKNTKITGNRQIFTIYAWQKRKYFGTLLDFIASLFTTNFSYNSTQKQSFRNIRPFVD